MNSKNYIQSCLLGCCIITLLVIAFCAGCTTTQSTQGISIVALDDQTGHAITSYAAQYERDTKMPVTVTLYSPEIWDPALYQDYSLIVTDIPDLATLAEQGIIKPITMMDDGALNKTTFDAIMLHPYIIDEKLYGLALQPDMLGYVIWGDLFEDPEEIAAFNETYGYDIGNPLTYHELLSITEFISRPENGRYSIGIPGNEADTIQNLHESILRSYGSTQTDSDAIEAEAVFQELISYAAPEYMTWNREDVAAALREREVQSAIMWFSEFGTLSSPENNPDNEPFIFLSLPGSWNSNGSFHSITILDGQVFAIPYGHDEDPELIAFLNWFYHPDTQWSWMEDGMQPMIHEIQESWEYLMANGYNAAYIISLRNAWTLQ